MKMAIDADEIIRRLPAARRRKIEARAAELIAEYMTLRDLRRARRLTQRRMAAKLGIGQDGVSRLEKRSDLLLSTLGGYVDAMGGRLRLVAEFPDRPPVILNGLADLDHGTEAPKRAAAARTPRRTVGAKRTRSRRKRP